MLFKFHWPTEGWVRGTVAMPAPLATAPVLPAQLLPPAGFRLATAAELRVGPALVRAVVLYRWPLDGWVQGRVRRVCRRAGFSHVVGYAASSSLGAVEVDTLLDSGRCGVARAGGPLASLGGCEPALSVTWCAVCACGSGWAWLLFGGTTVMVLRARARGQGRKVRAANRRH